MLTTQLDAILAALGLPAGVIAAVVVGLPALSPYLAKPRLAAMTALKVTLDAELDQFVADQVRSGAYPDGPGDAV